jgi:hypothetical protein
MKNIKKEYNKNLKGLAKDSAHGCVALRAFALEHLPALLINNFLAVLNLNFLFALNAICFHSKSPLKMTVKGISSR